MGASRQTNTNRERKTMKFNVNNFDHAKKFGRFVVTVEVEGEYSRADVWLKNRSVNLEYVTAGTHSGDPAEDAITDAVWNTSEELAPKMESWAYSTGDY